MHRSGFTRIAKGLIRRAHSMLFDMPFDRFMAVDTFETGLKTPPSGRVWHAGNYGHASSPAMALWHAIGSLNVDVRKFVFVDVGSGKGRCLLVASALPFRRVEGVEVSAELHQNALKNIRNYSGPRKAPIVTHRLDARDYRIPTDPCLIYMYNPFGEAVLRPLLRNIVASWHKTPRPMYIVYVNPIKNCVLEESPYVQKLQRSRWHRALDPLLFPHAVEFYQVSPVTAHVGH